MKKAVFIFSFFSSIFGSFLWSQNFNEEDTLGEDGLSLIKFIKDTYTNIFCLCYSMYKGAGIVEQAVKARADGYISKKAGLEVILQAMEKVIREPGASGQARG